MLSQALESVTRAYYARSDLDLILSSPASSRRLFAVRTGAIALTTVAARLPARQPDHQHAGRSTTGRTGSPPMASSPRFGALSTAIAVLITIALFRLVGPKRTRLIAQIVAAIVGAGFVIGIQAAAILDLRQHVALRGAAVADVHRRRARPRQPRSGCPPAPPWAISAPLLVMLLIGFGALAAASSRSASSSFGRHAIAAAGAQPHPQPAPRVDRGLPAAPRRSRRCGSRNGSCCRATPGCSARR